MSSCVRYSVAVYTGLLLAGAAIAPRPQASVGSDHPGQAIVQTHPLEHRHGRACVRTTAPAGATVTDHSSIR